MLQPRDAAPHRCPFHFRVESSMIDGRYNRRSCARITDNFRSGGSRPWRGEVRALLREPSGRNSFFFFFFLKPNPRAPRSTEIQLLLPTDKKAARNVIPRYSKFHRSSDYLLKENIYIYVPIPFRLSNRVFYKQNK